MLSSKELFYPDLAMQINLPKVNFLLVLSIGVVLYLAFFSPDFTPKKIWSIKALAKEDDEEKDDTWRVSLVHFFLGGLAVPKLISFFGALGFIQIIAYFFLRSHQDSPAEINLWFRANFLDTKAVGAGIFQMVFFYIGLWVGIPFSLDTIRRIYKVKSGRPIIVKSLILLLGFSMMSAYYASTADREDFFLSNDFNIVDLCVRIALFAFFTKWYMYRIVITKPPPSPIEDAGDDPSRI